MRKIIIGLIGSVLISAVFADVASAETPKIPNVATVAIQRPFSTEVDYMSLPGYLRYLLHLATGQWLTYKDAAEKLQSG